MLGEMPRAITCEEAELKKPKPRSNDHCRRPKGRAVLTGLLALLLAMPLEVAAADWSPIPVWVWDPPFDTASPRTKKSYEPLGTATREWRVCASIPHLKDAYWLGVNYGLVDEARRLDVTLSVFEAGGYGNLDEQKEQISACLEDSPDALIVSAVDFDKLNPTLAKVHAKGIPIIDMINGVSFPKIAARTVGDYYDNGFEAGRYLVEQNQGSEDPLRVLWFPGPKGAGWVTRGDQGFNAALKGTNVEILATAYGDTGKNVQGELIEAALVRHPEVDYIVGTTVTAEAAIGIVRRKRLRDKTKVLAYYFGPGVYRGLKRGAIVAAPSDLQVIQARIAMDQAVRILEGKPYLKHVGPVVVVTDKESVDDFDLSTSLAPKGFKATFDVN